MKKILLVCNAGMSTSLLVQKMQKDVAAQGLDLEVEARPQSEAMDQLHTADVVMLGPQVGYLKGEFEAAGDAPVTVIPMTDYGRMKTGNIIKTALELMGE